ncbi:hypothetical protein BD626DRAFT_523579 [Schizophyllum amplum]|uniref:Uncharacterized protein n=1 Tax=Schizophyllum amplum TaxID=97359 RepID=A0A550BSZ1_9AGAR|nr:hypothetical protein BD626DRAFT_523579 [Auriculariopsis ampla]
MKARGPSTHSSRRVSTRGRESSPDTSRVAGPCRQLSTLGSHSLELRVSNRGREGCFA